MGRGSQFNGGMEARLGCQDLGLKEEEEEEKEGRTYSSPPIDT